MNWSNEDIKLVEKFIEIRNKGFYCDGTQLTQVYNRALGKSVAPTNCGSCIRARINELEGALNSFKKLSETKTEDKVEDIPQEENKAVKKAKNKK